MTRLIRWWMIRGVWMFAFRETMKHGQYASFAIAQADHAADQYGARFHGLIVPKDSTG